MNYEARSVICRSIGCADGIQLSAADNAERQVEATAAACCAVQKRGKYKLQPVSYYRDGLNIKDILLVFRSPTFLLYSRNGFIMSIINTALPLALECKRMLHL